MASTAAENQRTPRVFISYSHDTRSIVTTSCRSRSSFGATVSTPSWINSTRISCSTGRVGAKNDSALRTPISSCAFARRNTNIA